MTAEQFIKHHFKGIEKETWYPAIVAIAEGYAKHEMKKLKPTNPARWRKITTPMITDIQPRWSKADRYEIIAILYFMAYVVSFELGFPVLGWVMMAMGIITFMRSCIADYKNQYWQALTSFGLHQHNRKPYF